MFIEDRMAPMSYCLNQLMLKLSSPMPNGYLHFLDFNPFNVRCHPIAAFELRGLMMLP